MKAVGVVFFVCFIIIGATIYLSKFYNPVASASSELAIVETVDLGETKEGIHLPTGLKADANLELVIANCTPCHSAKLISQNRATKEGWKNTIVWMQQTQNLWDLGENEEKIIAYLAKNYAPELQGRRKPLENIEWYELK